MLNPRSPIGHYNPPYYDNDDNFSDEDEDEENIYITSEEINYLKDHPPHFHSHSHNHNHKYNHGHTHSHSYCYAHHHKMNNDQNNDHYYRRSASEYKEYNPLSLKIKYNRNHDDKTHHLSVPEQYSEENNSDLIDPIQSKGINDGSDILLHQIKNQLVKNSKDNKNDVVQHIKKCSCNSCIEKSFNQSHDDNLIPIFKTKKCQSKRPKYNIFDTLYYENNNNNNNKNNNINKNSNIQNTSKSFLSFRL
ncbi:hypothetical protein U3516DRAFT_865120 [Neocallimastix sp. 'constans']